MKSVRSVLRRRRSAPTSTRCATAAMTIAPSTASGRSWNSGMRKSIVTIRKPNRIRLESCDLTPDESATADRERLASTAKPCSRPAPRLETPRAMSSWSASTSYLRFAASARAPATDSAKQMSASAKASGSRSVTSPSPKPGMANEGSPSGIVPTMATPWSSRPKTATAATPSATAISIAGIFGTTARSRR